MNGEIPNLQSEGVEVSADDAPYAGAFIDSVCEMMSTMAGMDVTPGAMHLKDGCSMPGDISGVMDVSGACRGFVAVCFKMETAADIVAALLGQDREDLTPADVADGVYEAVNMIAGGAKAKLSGTPYHFEMSTPLVILGREYESRTPCGCDTPCLVVPFEGSEAQFILQICLVATVDR